MKDLTTGSIPKHIIALALPMAAGMVFQTMYFLVDLFFVAKLGDAVVAGVSSAGNVQFIVMALTQVLGAGTMALIAHAVGRKDRDDANVVFNQTTLMAMVCGVATLVGGYLLANRYMLTVGADAATVTAGTDYLFAYIPGLALQFALVSMGSALRGTGIVKPTILVQILTVILNIILAPILIAGWGTGIPLGATGAGLASSIAILAGVGMLSFYFLRLEHYVAFNRQLMTWRTDVVVRVLKIGVPPGGEFALMFLFAGVTYYVIRDFGAAAQAGYGIGARVMQAIFLPAMAVAFSAAPLAGQNVGARQFDRVRETFRWAIILGCVPMALLTILCQFESAVFIGAFTNDVEVIAVGEDFLRIISWNFVAIGLVFTCSGMFQAMGNTIPSLVTSTLRFVTFALPALWLSRQAGFQLHQVWILSVLTVAGQAVLSILLVRREMRRLPIRLQPKPATR